MDNGGGGSLGWSGRVCDGGAAFGAGAACVGVEVEAAVRALVGGGEEVGFASLQDGGEERENESGEAERDCHFDPVRLVDGKSVEDPIGVDVELSVLKLNRSVIQVETERRAVSDDTQQGEQQGHGGGEDEEMLGHVILRIGTASKGDHSQVGARGHVWS